MLHRRQQLTDNGPRIFEETVLALRNENEKNRKKTDGDDFLYHIQKKRDELKNDASRSDT